MDRINLADLINFINENHIIELELDGPSKDLTIDCLYKTLRSFKINDAAYLIDL